MGARGPRPGKQSKRPSASAMASAAAAQASAPPPAQPDWLALPLELLLRCFSHLEDKRAALSSCRRLARAVLLNSLQQEQPACLRWDVDRAEPFAPSARLVQALVGEQANKGLTLVFFSDDEYDYRSPALCLDELRASGAALPCITRLEMQGLSLDVLIADGTSTVLPNLRQLCISDCQLTVAAADSLVNMACGRLQHVEVEGLRSAPTHLTKQLQQLAGLPSLSSISLLDDSCPTQFLNALATRLTALHLDKSCRQVEEGTQTPTPAWRATLQHVARCTALQSLAIPCVTSEELGLAAPALQQLRRLHLNGALARADGDAVVERLLGLPHLTSLRWEDASWHTFQRSHVSSPCRWRELSFEFISPHQLARLPLHVLASPVTWQHLALDQDTVAEVQAAADNVSLRSPLGGVWRQREQVRPSLLFTRPEVGDIFTGGAGEGDTPAALLRALRPLLAVPGLSKLSVFNLAWDMELVQALGDALPRTCTSFCRHSGSLALPACVQLAVSLPWLEVLALGRVIASPQSVLCYLSAVKGVAACQGWAHALRELVVTVREDEGEWAETEADAAELGMGVDVTIRF